MAISGTFDSDDKVVWKDAVVKVSVDGGSTYAAITTWSNMVTFTRGTYSVETEALLDGSKLRSVGNLGPGRVAVTCVYDEESSGPWKNLNDVFIAGSALDLVSLTVSKDSSATSFLYTTINPVLVACSLPPIDANNTMAGKFTFEIECDDMTQSLVGT